MKHAFRTVRKEALPVRTVRKKALYLQSSGWQLYVAHGFFTVLGPQNSRPTPTWGQVFPAGQRPKMAPEVAGQALLELSGCLPS